MIQDIIRESLTKSFSYEAYTNLIESLLAQNRTTGEDQSEFMVTFTRRNRIRSKRIEEELSLTPEQEAFFANLKGKQTWVVISEGWCADAAQILPVLNKVAQANPLIDLRIVLRDENEALMNEFLTGGGKAIPMLIITDSDTLEVLHRWGPRPKTATAMVEAYKREHGKLSMQFKEDLQKWYNQDKGQSIISDLETLLA